MLPAGGPLLDGGRYKLKVCPFPDGGRALPPSVLPGGGPPADLIPLLLTSGPNTSLVARIKAFLAAPFGDTNLFTPLCPMRAGIGLTFCIPSEGSGSTADSSISPEPLPGLVITEDSFERRDLAAASLIGEGAAHKAHKALTSLRLLAFFSVWSSTCSGSFFLPVAVDHSSQSHEPASPLPLRR